MMGIRSQRSSLAADGHIACPKVGDRRDSRALRNDGRLGDLQRGPDRPEPIFTERRR